MADHPSNGIFTKSITLGNLISPLLTIASIGIPALIWGGRIDTRVDYLANDLNRSLGMLRVDMDNARIIANTMAASLVTMNTTLTEGIKATMAEQNRRIIALEAKLDRQSDELTKMQIEIARLRQALDATARRAPAGDAK